MKLTIPDLISNSYFPALAAAELGYFRREELDVTVELIFPVDRAYEALHNGEMISLVAPRTVTPAARISTKGIDTQGPVTEEHFHTRWNHRGFRNGVEM